MALQWFPPMETGTGVACEIEKAKQIALAELAQSINRALASGLSWDAIIRVIADRGPIEVLGHAAQPTPRVNGSLGWL